MENSMNAIDRLKFSSPGASESLTEYAGMLLHMAYSIQGARALVCNRDHAATHEAGHTVAHFAHGDRIRSVRVFERGGSWLGMTRAGKRWRIDPESEPASDLKQARIYLAGPLAEWFYTKSPAFGAGVDEIALARGIVDQVAPKLGVDEVCLMEQTMMQTFETMERHRPALDEIARRLMRRPKLEGKSVEAIMRGYR
jgi:ATP-dependent Zn protease